jgi:iron complex outermembrane receptor protein
MTLKNVLNESEIDMRSTKITHQHSAPKIGRTLGTASWAFAFAGVAHLPLAAQSLEEVVISATRSEQRSFDAPAAINVVDRDTIQSAGPQVNLSESLNRVPGLTILNRQNYAQDLQLSIRGFGARTPFGIRGIRLLIDGIPATTPDGQGQGSSISLPSTERIEVLRGPLALMYGNSSGGVIQAFTRDAPEVPEFTAQAYTGSFDMRRTAWQYAGRIGDYGLVADYSTFDTNGFRDNSKTQRTQFNGKLSFNPNDQTQVNVVFNQFDMPLAQDPLGLSAAQVALNPRQAVTSSAGTTNAADLFVRKITRQNQIGSAITYMLDADRSVTARAYYGVRENLQYQATSAWVGLNRDYYGAGLQYNEKTSLAGRPVRLAAGYEFDYSTERRQGGATSSSGQQSSSALTRNEDNRSQNSDFFAQATTLATDTISVITGVRSSTVSFTSQDYIPTPVDGSGSVTYRATSPVLGLTYHATDRLNLYANYGKGFETPTLAEVAYIDNGVSTPTAKFNPSLRAASSQHYEIGAKWLPSNTSRVDLTAYQIDSRDEIVVAYGGSGPTSYKNVPGTQRRGLELAANNWLTPHVSALLSSSWIDATFTQSYASGTNNVTAGNKMPGIPQHFVFSELLWTSQGMGGDRRSAKLGTRAGFEWVSAGRLYANDTNLYGGSSASAPGYNAFNAKVSQGWALGNNLLTAYARVDNLADKRYVGSVIVNQSSGQFYEPAPGRTWTLGLRFAMPM